MKSYKKDKVILIQPNSGGRLNPPLSLLYLSEALIKENIQVKILDQRTENYFYEELRKEIFDEKVICIGITSIIGDLTKEEINIMNFIKKIKNIPIVLGGPHATNMPLQTLEKKEIDFVITFRGELPFKRLVKAIQQNSDYSQIKGLGFKENNKIILNSPNHEENKIHDLKLRKIPFYLINKKKYDSMGLITSYGCNSNCFFCSIRSLTPNIYFLPVKNIVQMIAHSIKNGYKKIVFYDDNFLMNKKRVYELFEECNKKGLKFECLCSGRIDHVLSFNNEELIWLRNNGLKIIHMGVESGSKKILKLINKRITIEQIIKLNLKLKQVSIIPEYGFIRNFPTERKVDFDETKKLIRRLKEDNKDAHIFDAGRYIPFPHTKIYELAKREGFKTPQKFEEWGRIFENVTPNPGLNNDLIRN